MDRDSFIIAVFLIGCEQYGIIRKQYRLRRGGFEPALTDEEVITIEIYSEYFKLECDQAIDTLPLPVCALTRARRDHCFPAEADFGYFAAKEYVTTDLD